MESYLTFMCSIYKGFPTFGLCSVYTGFQFIQGSVYTGYFLYLHFFLAILIDTKFYFVSVKYL